MDQFETPRLRAERLRLGHLEELRRMHGEPRVMATLGGVRSEDETRQFLAANLAHWDRWSYGLWMFRDTAGFFVGRGGLRHVTLDGVDEVELAYALMPDFWGKGLATEMAQALLSLALSRFGLTGVVSFTLVTNRASGRVMKKLGLKFERQIDHAGQPHVLYRAAPPEGTATGTQIFEG
jgi:RimJ/RimL family protein N-acetyltransferase